MSRKDENLWVSEGADRGKWRDAERARLNRREIQHALVTFQTPDEILAGAFPPYSSTSNGSATGK